MFCSLHDNTRLVGSYSERVSMYSLHINIMTDAFHLVPQVHYSRRHQLLSTLIWCELQHVKRFLMFLVFLVCSPLCSVCELVPSLKEKVICYQQEGCTLLPTGRMVICYHGYLLPWLSVTNRKDVHCW